MHSPSARPSPAPQLWATARNRRCNWRVPQSRRWSARGQRRTSNSHCRGPSIWPGRSRLAARAAARNRRHADESRHNSHRPRTRRRTQPRPQGPRRQFLRSTPRAPWARCSSGSPRSPGGRNPRCTPGRARMPGRDCSRLRGCRTIGGGGGHGGLGGGRGGGGRGGGGPGGGGDGASAAKHARRAWTPCRSSALVRIWHAPPLRSMALQVASIKHSAAHVLAGPATSSIPTPSKQASSTVGAAQQ
jgi:hypothetical protein